MSENAIKITLYPKASYPLPAQFSPTSLYNPVKCSQRACGKAIIIGEHAVVYGAQAVAMPIPSMRMEITFQRELSSQQPPACTLGHTRAPQQLTGVVEDAFRLLDLKAFPVRIEGHSAILIGSGLGSSAALCIVILRAIAESVGLKISTSRLAYLGNELEKRFHGTPSGLDTTVVAYEKIIAFQKMDTEKWVQPIPVQDINAYDETRHPWNFALIDSQIRSSTLAMINKAAPYFKGAQGHKRIECFHQLAEQVKNGLTQGHADAVAQAMNEASAMLGESGVITPLLDEIIQLSLQEGVMAAKPTGAGGGGCILVLLRPSASRAQLQQLKRLFGDDRVVNVRIHGSSQ